MPEESPIIRCGDLVVTLVTTEYHLGAAWMRMVDEGVLATVFHQKIPTRRSFLEDAMTSGNRITLSCFREIPDQKPEFCGLGWVYGSIDMGGFKRAETGMWFSKHQTRKTDNLKFGAMCFDVFFQHCEIDALFGTTPEPNKLALRYAARLGMQLIGPIPDLCTWEGRLVPGWFSHVNRLDWLARRR